jgi:hypothetical protein
MGIVSVQISGGHNWHLLHINTFLNTTIEIFRNILHSLSHISSSFWLLIVVTLFIGSLVISQAVTVILTVICVIARSERDGTCAETRFGHSAKRTSPFKSAGVSVQSTAAQSRCAYQRTASVLSLTSTLITAWKCRYKAGRYCWKAQFVMCGCVYVCGFCDVWVCVCVCVLVICILALFGYPDWDFSVLFPQL